MVAGGDGNGGAVIWNALTGKVAQRLGEPAGNVIGAEFSSDGDRLLVVDGNQKRATIWDLVTDRLWRRVPTERAARADLFGARFVPSPLRVLTFDTAERAKLSDPAAGATVTLPGKVYPPAVAASLDGAHIALGTTGGELYVLSGQGGPPRTSRVTEKGVNTVAFDREGTAIATGAQTGIATAWDARTLTATPLRALGGEVTGATFSPNGDLVLVTSGVTARLWIGRLQRVIVELPREPRTCKPSSAPTEVASCSQARSVRRCSAATPARRSTSYRSERARSFLPRDQFLTNATLSRVVLDKETIRVFCRLKSLHR